MPLSAIYELGNLCREPTRTQSQFNSYIQTTFRVHRTFIIATSYKTRINRDQ